MKTEFKTVEKDCSWALVNTRTLQIHTPWIKGSKEAVEFAHKHCHGWDLEPYLDVTDWESYRRLKFQRETIPRMVEASRKRIKTARTVNDLVEFRPFRAELKRGTGEKQIW